MLVVETIGKIRRLHEIEGLPIKAIYRRLGVSRKVARAFRYQKLLDEGRYASITEMAAAEKIDRGYLGRILILALLSPSAIDALLQGPALAAELREIRRAASLPWAEQEAALHLRPSEERRGKQ